MIWYRAHLLSVQLLCFWFWGVLFYFSVLSTHPILTSTNTLRYLTSGTHSASTDLLKCKRRSRETLGGKTFKFVPITWLAAQRFLPQTNNCNFLLKLFFNSSVWEILFLPSYDVFTFDIYTFTFILELVSPDLFWASGRGPEIVLYSAVCDTVEKQITKPHCYCHCHVLSCHVLS